MKIQKFAPDTAQVVVGVMSRADSKIAVKEPGTFLYDRVMEANRDAMKLAMLRHRCGDGAIYASKLYGGHLIETVKLDIESERKNWSEKIGSLIDSLKEDAES